MGPDIPQRHGRYPLGVLVVAALTALRVVAIVVQLAGVQGGAILDWLGDVGPLPGFRPDADVTLILTVLIVGVLIASVLAVVGLLLRRRWAWVLSIVSAGIILAVDIGWWFAGEPRPLSMFLNVIAVFYLNQREVRAALRDSVPTT